MQNNSMKEIDESPYTVKYHDNFKEFQSSRKKDLESSLPLTQFIANSESTINEEENEIFNEEQQKIDWARITTILIVFFLAIGINKLVIAKLFCIVLNSFLLLFMILFFF